MRVFAPKVTLESPSGGVLRHIPGKLAQEMVARGIAEISNANGRVKAIRLLATAEAQVQRIGPPSPPSLSGVRFFRRVKLEESGAVVFEHHPRSTYE